MKSNTGATLLETLIAIGIFSLLSVAATWLVFSSVNLRDATLATTRTIESLRVFNHTLRQAVTGAQTVTHTPTTLNLFSSANCWSFAYSALQNNLLYDHTTTPGCVPNPNPTTLFFPTSTQLTNFSFSVYPLATGGRQVIVASDIQTVLPFSDYQTSFSQTIVNLVD